MTSFVEEFGGVRLGRGLSEHPRFVGAQGGGPDCIECAERTGPGNQKV
jgi:hypothetical protein